MTPSLKTKFYIPKPRTNSISRPRLIEALHNGLQKKLTLLSSPAGFGKSTLLSQWANGFKRSVCWLSLDSEDSDLPRFLSDLITAIQTIVPEFGLGIDRVLQVPQQPNTKSLLKTLINDLTDIPKKVILVLDDYHVCDSVQVDDALTYLLEHQPAGLHLVISSREDPNLPLARLRVQDQLNELRAADLRFTQEEVTSFLQKQTGLGLSQHQISILEKRTEGWIAGLQLAAVSLSGHKNTREFIESFSGSHRFVLDYLVEEVLNQQSETIKHFLQVTSILDRFCGSLCDAVLQDASVSSQETIEYLENSNLFIIALDNSRQWYRYHHLFADILRQCLHHQVSVKSDGKNVLSELNHRASLWFEEQNLTIEAFKYGARAGDFNDALRLAEGKGIPIYYQGAAVPVINWLRSLSSSELNSDPRLLVMYASALLANGRNSEVESKLLAAEAVLEPIGSEINHQDLKGQIATQRALLAAPYYQADSLLKYSRQALKNLDAENLTSRAIANWTLGFAYQLTGNTKAAGEAYYTAVSIARQTGNLFVDILASTGLGLIQEADLKLSLAVKTYQQIVDSVGEPALPTTCEAYLGLARIRYERNEIEWAEKTVLTSIQLAQQIEHADTFVAGQLLLIKIYLTQGKTTAASELLKAVEESVRENQFNEQIPDVAAAKVDILLIQENQKAAALVADSHDLPLCKARIAMNQGDAERAFGILTNEFNIAEEKNEPTKQLHALILLALALWKKGEKQPALNRLSKAMDLAEPAGILRSFADKGLAMLPLLNEAMKKEVRPDYTGSLLEVFAKNASNIKQESSEIKSSPHSLLEPLSKRELEILRLVAQGLSNQEIGQQLFIALDTVKGHNRNLFAKLGVQRRTEAVSRAHELGII